MSETGETNETPAKPETKPAAEPAATKPAPKA